MPKSLGAVLGLFIVAAVAAAGEPSDVVVYGGTPGGVMAAVAAGRAGRSVLLVDPNNHVGGVVSGGLTSTDTGDLKTVGGLAAEFFARVADHYKTKYGADSKQFAACHNGVKFEPSVAEAIFDRMLAEAHVTVMKRHRLLGYAVKVDGGRIVSIGLDDLNAPDVAVTPVQGAVFVDASYEGDLMAAVHVPYRVGREARSEYGEILGGVGAGPKALRGTGDHRTMSYNYRVCITSNTENRVLCPKPENYDPRPFEHEGDAIRAGRVKQFIELYAGREKSAGPNEKYDSNWADFVGNSEGYAEGDWTTRQRIADRQRDYVMSRLYYFQNDPSLPEAFRLDAQKWGLPKDEFTDSGHFPFQLYVREARRMVGRYVLRESDLTQDRYKTDGVCDGSYGVDCHTIQQILDEGRLVLEHTNHVAITNYDIPYACLTPIEPSNLLVPVCCSATHVAYCSVRMEPVYMMLGHAAGDAAALALANKTSVQQVDVGQLRAMLTKEHAILDGGYQPPVKLAFVPAHPKPGEPVTFRAEIGAVKDPIERVWWDFDGSGKVGAEGEKAEHTFTTEKRQTVSLLVQDKLGRRRLVSAEVPVGAADARDLTVDDFDADLFGRWDGVYPQPVVKLDGPRSADVFYGPGIHRDVVRNGKPVAARARFEAAVPRAGRYLVCLGFRPAKDQATNVPVTIKHAGGAARLKVDERAETTPFNFTAIGEFRFNPTGGFVEVTNGNTDGRVAIDGVRFVWVGE